MLILKLPLMVGVLLACEPFAIGQEFNAALIIQPPAASPLRLDDAARQLSAQDIATLALLMPAGKDPWLFSGVLDATMIPTIGAYLPAATETPELRRGTMITLRWPDDAPGSKVWTVVESNGAYAQNVTGRSTHCAARGRPPRSGTRPRASLVSSGCEI